MPFRLLLTPPPELIRGLARAPQAVREELMRGMDRATRISAASVRTQIQATTQTNQGRLLRGTRRNVTEEGGGRIVGRVGIGKPGRDPAFFAKKLNTGGTITARGGGMLAIPLTPEARRQREEWRRAGIRTLRDVAEELQLVRGSANTLIISRTESQVRFVLKRSVNLRARRFMETGMQNAAASARAALEAAYRRALRRIAKGGG